MAIKHDEHWYLCEDCEGTQQVSVPVGEDENVTELGECPNCWTGYTEGDDDDCETNPCDVATGALTL